MNSLTIDWTAVGAAELAETIALRRAIHAEPELGLHCPHTTAKLRAALDGLPLEIHESRSTSGFIAILRGREGGNGRTVLLRGDMDALPLPEETGLPFASTTPGRMHACGHDSHSAMLVGAARALCARADKLPGTVVFMFQPGEEGHHGARFMIEDGLLDIAPADAAFALHIWPTIKAGVVGCRAGPMLASTDQLTLTVRGRGGHAAMPHDAIDPVPVAAEIITALSTFIARHITVHDPAVLSITTMQAGATFNVIPNEVKMTGTLRALSDATRVKARDGLIRIVRKIAEAHDCTGEVAIDEGYPVTMNDPRAVALIREIAEAQEPGSFRTLPNPNMGGEDFSYVLRKVPGAMAFLGVATEGDAPEAKPPLHNSRMMIDERVMAKGIALHCAYAQAVLERGLG